MYSIYPPLFFPTSLTGLYTAKKAWSGGSRQEDSEAALTAAWQRDTIMTKGDNG